MCATQLMQLQPMLDEAKEAVRRRQPGGVLASDITSGRQRVERDKCRAAAQRLVAAPMHELQQLYGELDIAQTTWSELDLTVDFMRRHVLDDATTHCLHVRDEAVALRGR